MNVRFRSSTVRVCLPFFHGDSSAEPAGWREEYGGEERESFPLERKRHFPDRLKNKLHSFHHFSLSQTIRLQD
jgi:hypothetical protein